MNENLNFGQALEALKQGKLITRKGWNGKDMFLFIRPPYTCKLTEMLGFISVPRNVKDYYELKHQPITVENEPKITFTGYICMKAADDTIVNGWLASQTDMFAEDWFVLD
jgi:hypothetical protein